MIVKRITNENDLQKAFEIRKKVFVEEQNVPEVDEFDEYDVLCSTCEHILIENETESVATGRLRKIEDIGKIERICVLASKRDLGLGKKIIVALEEIAKKQGIMKLKLHGQTHAEGFYHKLGYETTSDVFMEDGIPHIVMEKTL